MKKSNSTKKFNMYEAVTERIIEQLEQGIIPWSKPWICGNGAWSRSTGKHYTLINQMLLDAGEYATMHEINECGGKVNKGAKASYVWSFWYNVVVDEDTIDPKTGEPRKFMIPKAKYTKVFNIERDTDLEPRYKYDKVAKGVNARKALEEIKVDYIERASLKYDEVTSDRAYYSPAEHRVQVPKRAQFDKVAEFYSTVFHELAHSTGHKSLLNRFTSTAGAAAFGSEEYSREELVAEITACAVLANTGVETKTSFRNNSAYIQNWLKALKEDDKAIIRASAKAEAAYKLIMNISDDEDGADA